MLEKVVAALKADKATALSQFTKGEGGFKDRDLYVFCSGADGRISAHGFDAGIVGKQLVDFVDKTGKKFGEEIRRTAAEAEGTIAEVAYMWARPGQTGEGPRPPRGPIPAGRWRTRRTCYLFRAG